MSIRGLDGLLVALDVAPERLQASVVATTNVAANKIRKDARRRVEGLTHLPHYPRTITYDLEIDGNRVSAEIGADREGQGSLGHLIEYGSPTSTGRPHLQPALAHEAPIWTRFLGKAVRDSLW